MINFDDLDDGLTSSKKVAAPATPADIATAAHIVNGGDASFPCPQCHGTGQVTIGWTNRRSAPCFKCKSTGKVSKGQVAAVKAKETRLNNDAQFAQDHAAEIAFLQDNQWSDFYKSLLAQYQDRKRLTDNQIASVRKGMAKAAQKKEERKEARTAAAPTLNISAIEALFAKATNNAVKKPIFRTLGVTLQLAPAHGVNAGSLYVYETETKEYCGKITAGKYHHKYGTPNLTEALKLVADNPEEEVIKYASKLKACSCCGRTLANPVSVLAVVGPICAGNWGLEHLREAAAEEYKRLKEEEAAALGEKAAAS